MPVDPRLEITEIATRVVRSGGPALLFESPVGSDMPLLINPLGTARRVELALGRPPEAIGAMLLETAQRVNPPSPRALWGLRSNLMQLLPMRTTRVRQAACHEIVDGEGGRAVDLGALPVQTCWPGDGGRFITFGLVITRDPVTGERNTGVYRMHVHDATSTGMHWQILKGGGFHYARAEEMGRPLEVAVALGVDPALLISAVMALPEGMDEIGFSGILRRAPCKMVRCKSVAIDVPANAEIVLEGVVRPHERRMEGPFGDHFGHYSHAAPFPVFEISRVTKRRDAMYLGAVVGKPPQEDKYIGNATQDIIGPLIKVIYHEIDDVWAYFEAGFHNLLVVSVRQRFYKEAVKTALALLGTGQLALTKCLVLVDAEVNARDFGEVLAAVRDNFEPARDFMLLPGTPLDTLDFTSFQMNLGSKMVIDATSGPAGGAGALHAAPGADAEAVRAAIGDPAAAREIMAELAGSEAGRSPSSDGPAAGSTRAAVPDARQLDDRVTEFRALQDCLLVVKIHGDARQVVGSLLDRDLGPVRLVAAVSDDVDLGSQDELLWGIFTRFDCARDVLFRHIDRRGPWTTCQGPMGIDATFKPGYPEPLVMDPEVVDRVNRRWSEYGID